MGAPEITASATKSTVIGCQNATVVDLFCGAGGLSHGFYLEGMKVVAGIDLDPACKFAYEANNGAKFLCQDVSTVTAADLVALWGEGPRILVGCAPCQPFSSYAQRWDNPDWKLLENFAQLIVDSKPDVVSMENVPRLLDFQDGAVFERFVSKIRRAGYKVTATVAYAPDYGVPQHRHRLVLLASRHAPIALEPPTHSKKKYVTVRKAIGKLRELEAGGIDEFDPLHRTSRLSPLNLKRIRAAKPGGSWKDWDEELVAPCHKTQAGKTYVSVYGRMNWDEPSPTMTTQFFGFGNGRFGHPEQNRAISLREGAILQSFPTKYRFVPEGEAVQFKKLGRLIGNAVPVLLGRAIAKSIKLHLNTVGRADAS
ncbi:DNA cytosine methyltransferase [Pseudochrobactrum saccharolyticum]|nr:DNA cytosine methyltransferase [Pseudochrobactrum saccharolyticum]